MIKINYKKLINIFYINIINFLDPVSAGMNDADQMHSKIENGQRRGEASRAGSNMFSLAWRAS
jgi:hypothetical protein